MSLDKLHIRGYQLQRIPFVPAKNTDAHSIKPAELGFLCLNDPVEPQGEMGRKGGDQTPKGKPRSQELFRFEDVPMQWRQNRRLGTGFRNLGNTCFMNSVLQCLLHTPPLAELLLSGQPLMANKSGGSNGFDPIQITRQLVEESLGRKKNFVAPAKHAQTLRKVNRSFRMGRQEDAHEYLIALLDAMHERSIAGIPKPPPDVEFTSFIYRIFGGRIRSQVKCTHCNYESNTYDPFLDLSLEINHASSVDKALKRFTAGESLDGANKYKCPKENRRVRAVKRMTVETAPSVLVIQLKRFEFSMSGRKISKQVEFDPVLDLSPYMSQRPKTPAVYDLYGVLVHQGHSMHSGHYFCFVKGGANGDWHKFDDTRVNLTAERNVLGQAAYILFYIKRQMATPAVVAGPMPRPLQPKTSPNGLPPQKNQDNSKTLASAKRKREQELQQRKQLEAYEAKAALAAQQEKQQQQQQAKRQKKENGGVYRGGVDNRSHQENDGDDDDSDVNETASPPSPRKGRAGKQGSAVENDLPSRQQQRPRTNAMPHSPLLGRRGKRLEEARAIVRQAAQSRKVSNPKPSSPAPNNEAEGAITKPAPRKRLAALAQQDRQKQSRKRKAAAARVGNGGGENGVDDSGSYGSAVSAPDWPPVKSILKDAPTTVPALANGRVTKPTRAITSTKSTGQGAGKRDQGAVRDFLKAGTKPTLGLDTWEDADIGEKRQHDKLLYRAAPGRKQNDEYDEEYDRGKTKKVRGNASERGGGKLDSTSFDKAFKTQQENGRPEVQLRGKKKKAAEMADRQHNQGQRRQGGRGRGARRGGGGRGRGRGGRR